mgnify:CR=1 FL=1
MKKKTKTKEQVKHRTRTGRKPVHGKKSVSKDKGSKGFGSEKSGAGVKATKGNERSGRHKTRFPISPKAKDRPKDPSANRMGAGRVREHAPLFFIALLSMILLAGMLLTIVEYKDTTLKVIPNAFEDELLTTEDLAGLKQLDCQDIKVLLKTNKDACIYFRDKEGNIVDLTENGNFGAGCPGLEIDGQRICATG